MCLTEGTCCFPIPGEHEALIEFFSRIPLSQLLSVQPDPQHPVAVFFIAVLTCGQTKPQLGKQFNLF